MKNTEALILKEINRLNDEVLSLYYSGYHSEALREANNLLRIAREKLDHQHHFLPILHENFDHMKRQRREGPRSLDKNKLNNKKTRIEDIKRDIMVVDYSDEERDIPLKKKSSSIKWAMVFIGTILLFGQGVFVGAYIISRQQSIESSEEIQETSAYNHELQESVLLEVPFIKQYPELPRGCEVTSLAMLLQYAGIDVDKMTLAREVTKDPTPYKRENGKVFFGNPSDGFVGDMYSLDNPGLGVYHGPIFDLMEVYLPNQSVDLTGRSFEDIYYFLSQDLPIWVIINGPMKRLGDGHFQYWETPSGTIEITYRMHSVVITGYDEKYIYVNDPLYHKPNRRVNKEDFIEGWIQMGSQAITLIPSGMTLADILPHNKLD